MRIKRAKQFGTHALLMAGVATASASAQASTITTGNWIDGRVEAVQLTPPPLIDIGRSAGSIIISAPGPITPAVFLNNAFASSSVSGSMNYSVGTGSGYFSESDSSADGSMVTLELNRKGYGYRADAAAEAAQLDARAETKWIQGSNGYGYNSGSSSASATATWNDWFVISGGTGLATASFASLLDGVMASGKYGSAGYSLNIGYSPETYCYWYSACSEADRSQTLFSQTSSLSGKGKSLLSHEIEGEFTFAYDQAFQLTATLNVNATNGGMADFTLLSLGNSLALPDGARLLSSSGLYVQAVPEAETYAMMLAGLGLVGIAVARRRVMSK